MTNAECGKDFTKKITITDIDNLSVKFNGSNISFTVTFVSGNDWNVTVTGIAIPEAGTLTYLDKSSDIAVVTVDCP